MSFPYLVPLSPLPSRLSPLPRPLLNERIVFLDVETTGGSAIYDRIIEIGLVEIDCGRFVSEWSSLIDPQRDVPQGVQTLTGISDTMLATAPRFEEISAELAQRLEGKVLAAHNASFDYRFLRNEFRRAGVRYASSVLCTVKLSRRLFPQHHRHNLDALIMRHAIFCIDRHRALGDARVLWQLAQIWQRDLDERLLNAACADLLRRPSVPAGLPHDILDDLPEAPGVYIFYGANDIALYVGRAANIRSRVIAHFMQGHASGKDMQIVKAVQRVDWLETAGELGAYVHETRLVKKLAPLHNRQPGLAGEWCTWRWSVEDPASPPRLAHAHELEISDFAALYGLFRSRTSARAALRALAGAHDLCHVALGLEPRLANGACSAYELNSCRGACIGAESLISHAMRLVQALSKLRVKPWPYAGRIAIRERDSHSQCSELHVLDQWRYLGTAKSEAELHELTEAAPPDPFDLDTYKMLARFLKSPPSGCAILALPNP
jgi:DNA polymerase-3 subunit epsilon